MTENNNKNTKKEKQRTKNWATIVYPESAPENWIDILEEQHIPALISPLHNKDLDKSGKPKKPHYHIILLFDGLKTQDQAEEIFSLIRGIGTEKIKSLKSYTRYLCHLDNTNKVQYDTADIIELSGANFKYASKTANGKYQAIREMIEFCDENLIDSYATLILYAKDYREDWFQILCDNGTVTIVQYLKSRCWSNNRRERS